MRDANRATEQRQQGRLGQKLFQDVAAARADALANADLFRSFCYADQHDVHDHDAADHQRDRSYANGRNLNRAEDLVAQFVDRAGRDDAEVVFLVWRQVCDACASRRALRQPRPDRFPGWSR